MQSHGIREAARLTHKALAAARNGGIAGLAHATRLFLAGRYANWIDATLDRRFGIDTCGPIEDLVPLGVRGADLQRANHYEPVQLPVFRAMMRAARLDARRYVFIDLGSGKGRALVLAMEYGFRRAIGVELAPALHEIALRNIDTYRQRRPLAGPIELHHGDAADFELPGGDSVVFLYNPFREAVMREVAANIERACARQARSLWVAYRNPVHAAVFDGTGCLQLMVRDAAFNLYRSRA